MGMNIDIKKFPDNADISVKISHDEYLPDKHDLSLISNVLIWWKIPISAILSDTRLLIFCTVCRHFQMDFLERNSNLFLWVQSIICQLWFRKWHGADRPTSHLEPMVRYPWCASLLTHICFTQPPWVNTWILVMWNVILFMNCCFVLLLGKKVCQTNCSTFFFLHEQMFATQIVWHFLLFWSSVC